VNSEAAASLKLLMDGNQRFRSGASSHYRYPPDLLQEIATGQEPSAAVITCVDRRVVPETIFDQPVGSIFVSRVPGAVASESAKWMLEIAESLSVPLVVIMGHTDCLAVGQVVQGLSGPGGSLRMDIARAVHVARMKGEGDLYRRSVIENTLQTARELRNDSLHVRRAVSENRLAIVSALYDVFTGEVELLEEGAD
jgi:carbonic anhydrase